MQGRPYPYFVLCFLLDGSVVDLVSVPICGPAGEGALQRMSLDQNALSSLSASLADLTNRLGEVARAAGEDDDAVIDVLEVQRQLQTASRRLEKVLRRITRG